MNAELPLHQLDSVALVSRVHREDDDALNELCRRYLRRVWMLARAELGSALRARLDDWDVVQDVFISVVKNRLRDFEFEHESSLISYLKTILVNKIRDQAKHLRAKKRDVRLDRPMASPHSDSAAGGVADTTPSQIAARHEELLRLEQAMDLLREERPDYWELILAKEMEGRPIVDLARESKESPDAIRMRIQRAKSMLRDFMTTRKTEI